MDASLKKFRNGKDEAFKKASWSPLTDEQKLKFRNLNYYNENPKFIFRNIVIGSVDPEQTVEIPTSAGNTEQYLRAGKINFSLDGKKYQLNIYRDLEGNGYFLPIKDITSGNGTYKEGRYVDIEVNNDTIERLDFNYAYNPYCAYNHSWRCPITPEENKLPIAIEAGEKNFNDQQ